jgi:hypothetical protein
MRMVRDKKKLGGSCAQYDRGHAHIPLLQTRQNGLSLCPPPPPPCPLSLSRSHYQVSFSTSSALYLPPVRPSLSASPYPPRPSPTSISSLISCLYTHTQKTKNSQTNRYTRWSARRPKDSKTLSQNFSKFSVEVAKCTGKRISVPEGRQKQKKKAGIRIFLSACSSVAVVYTVVNALSETCLVLQHWSCSSPYTQQHRSRSSKCSRHALSSQGTQRNLCCFVCFAAPISKLCCFYYRARPLQNLAKTCVGLQPISRPRRKGS